MTFCRPLALSFWVFGVFPSAAPLSQKKKHIYLQKGKSHRNTIYSTGTFCSRALISPLPIRTMLSCNQSLETAPSCGMTSAISYYCILKTVLLLFLLLLNVCTIFLRRNCDYPISTVQLPSPAVYLAMYIRRKPPAFVISKRRGNFEDFY